MATPKAIICPSLLAADLSALAADSATMIESGADWLQCVRLPAATLPAGTLL